MPRQPKPPTVKTVAKHLAALQRAMAAVYADDGEHQIGRTTEHGTIFVMWKSGRIVQHERQE